MFNNQNKVHRHGILYSDSRLFIVLVCVLISAILGGCTGNYTMSNEVRPGGTVTMLYRATSITSMPDKDELIAKFVPDTALPGDPAEFPVTVRGLVRVHPDPVSIVGMSVDSYATNYKGQLMAVIDFKNANGEWENVYNEGGNGRTGKIVITDPNHTWSTSILNQIPGSPIEYSSKIRILPSLTGTVPSPENNVGISGWRCAAAGFPVPFPVCGYGTDDGGFGAGPPAEKISFAEPAPHVILKVVKDTDFDPSVTVAGAEINVTYTTSDFITPDAINTAPFPVVTKLTTDPRVQLSFSRSEDSGDTTIKILVSNPSGFSNGGLGFPQGAGSLFSQLSSVALAWKPEAELTADPVFTINPQFYDTNGNVVDNLLVEQVRRD